MRSKHFWEVLNSTPHRLFLTKKGNEYETLGSIHVLKLNLCKGIKCCHFHPLLYSNALRDIQKNGFYVLFLFLGSRSLDANLTRAAVRAAEWLRNNHDKDGTYGKGQVNGLVFHALSVVGYNVEHGAEILHAEINKEGGLDYVSGRALAAYVLGVVATCRDPWQFYGLDLVTSLQEKLDKYPQVGFNHPFQFSLSMIALCTAGKDVGKWKYVNYIINNIQKQSITTAYASGNTMSMHILALKCVEEFITRHNQIKFNLLVRIRGGIATASKELLRRQLLDGNFGQNLVTAARCYLVSF